MVEHTGKRRTAEPDIGIRSHRESEVYRGPFQPLVGIGKALRQIGASPARATAFDTYDEHPGAYISVMEGTTFADTLWRCTSNKGGTLNTTAITFVNDNNIHTATAKTTGADADEVGLWDSAVSFFKRMTLADIANYVKTKLGLREVLTADRTYYVRSDGSDSNTGLSNTSGGAFLTIQKAMDVIAANLDLAGFTVVIQVGAGTYTAGVTIKACVGQAGPNNLLFQGDAATPSNVVISITSGAAFSLAGPTIMARLRGFQLTGPSGTTRGIDASNGAVVNFDAMDFAAMAGTSFHIRAQSGASIVATGNYTISGGTTQHWQTGSGGTITVAGRTVTLTGTPAFTTFAAASVGSTMTVNANTFTGLATGARYSVSTNAVIYTNGGGASYLPGDSAGSTATGGQYT